MQIDNLLAFVQLDDIFCSFAYCCSFHSFFHTRLKVFSSKWQVKIHVYSVCLCLLKVKTDLTGHGSWEIVQVDR